MTEYLSLGAPLAEHLIEMQRNGDAYWRGLEDLHADEFDMPILEKTGLLNVDIPRLWCVDLLSEGVVDGFLYCCHSYGHHREREFPVTKVGKTTRTPWERAKEHQLRVWGVLPVFSISACHRNSLRYRNIDALESLLIAHMRHAGFDECAHSREWFVDDDLEGVKAACRFPGMIPPQCIRNAVLHELVGRSPCGFLEHGYWAGLRVRSWTDPNCKWKGVLAVIRDEDERRESEGAQA